MTKYIVAKKVEVKLEEIKTAQVKQLAEILTDKKNAGKEYDGDTIAKILQDSRLKTKQDPYSIFKYYQKQLIALGIIIVDKATTVVRASTKFSFVDGAGI